MIKCHRRVTASDDFEQNNNDLNVTECHDIFNTKNVAECHDIFNTKNKGYIGVEHSYSTMSAVTSACF